MLKECGNLGAVDALSSIVNHHSHCFPRGEGGVILSGWCRVTDWPGVVWSSSQQLVPRKWVFRERSKSVGTGPSLSPFSSSVRDIVDPGMTQSLRASCFSPGLGVMGPRPLFGQESQGPWALEPWGWGQEGTHSASNVDGCIFLGLIWVLVENRWPP